ncbi:hypothetical protein, partial [Undibacterium sp.]|uniref:hypothetical protein n=1 Tax=Undibacterium sp. TaxID=1914977 RepID=UPI003750C501
MHLSNSEIQYAFNDVERNGERMAAHEINKFRAASRPARSTNMLDEAATRRKQSIPTPKFKITILSQAFNGEGT